MTARRSPRTTIGAALREKFKSPREALKRLGIDERLLSEPGLAYDGAKKMKPNRLQYLLVTRAARIFNPVLAADAKVEYGPLFKGITTKNLKAKRPTIISDAKKALKGKTLAKDAGIESLAHLLNHLEHPPNEANLDESVSGSQHRAMEAAAHGHSNLGIPKNVGQEFEHADKGKTFRDALPAFLKDHGMDDEAVKEAMDMIPDELPDNALDEGEEENVNIEVEEGEDAEIEQEEGEDSEIEQEEAEDDEIEQEEAEDRHHGKDKAGTDKMKHGKDHKGAKDRKGAMDTSKFVTVDAQNKAIEAAVRKERESAAAQAEARAFVRPYVGELSMALDSAEKVLRGAAEMMGIDDLEDLPPKAVRRLIEDRGRRTTAADEERRSMATDSTGAKGFAERFPMASRIGSP